jgi:hypothetical protein
MLGWTQETGQAAAFTAGETGIKEGSFQKPRCSKNPTHAWDSWLI